LWLVVVAEHGLAVAAVLVVIVQAQLNPLLLVRLTRLQ
jgi:hypothetical protein